MDSGTLIKITAYCLLIKRGRCVPLSVSFAPQKNLTVYQNNNSGQKKYRPVLQQILRFPAKLDHNLRFKRHDESVLVCDRNLNKKKSLIQVFLISAMSGLILLITSGQTYCSKFCSTLFTLNS